MKFTEAQRQTTEDARCSPRVDVLFFGRVDKVLNDYAASLRTSPEIFRTFGLVETAYKIKRM